MSEQAGAEVHNIDEARSKRGASDPIVAVPAIGTSIAMNLGGECQITLQGFFDRDGDDAHANAIIDKMLRLARRQKATYDLKEHQDQLVTLEMQDRRRREDTAAVRQRFEEDIAAKMVEIGVLKSASDDAVKSSYDAHIASGKRGEHRPQGSAKSTQDRAKIGIAALEAEIHKKREEQALHERAITVQEERWTEEVAFRKAGIARCEELLKG